MALVAIFSSTLPAPRVLVRSEDNPLDIAVQVDAAAGTPTSATLTVRRGSTVIQTPTVTIASNAMTATVTAAALSAASVSLWEELDAAWEFTVSSVVEHFQERLIVVDKRIRPSLVPADLAAEYSELGGSSPCYPAGQTSYAAQMSASWKELMIRLSNEGLDRHPSLMMDAEPALWLPHKHLTLAKLAKAFVTSANLNSRWDTAYDDERQAYERAYAGLRARFRSRDSTEFPDGSTYVADDTIARPLSLRPRDPRGLGRF